MADHPPPLEVLAGVEAGRVDQRQDREVERVAERDEASGLLRGGDVECAGEIHRLVGDDADRSASDRREGGDDIAGEPAADLEQRVLVDDRLRDVADVVAPGGALGDELAGLGARAVGWIDERPGRGRGVDVVGQVLEQLGDHVGAGLAVGHDRDREAGVGREAGGAAEFVLADVDAGELANHDRAVHERVAVVGGDHEVHQSEDQRRARDGGAVEDRERRHGPRTAGDDAGDPPPTVQCRHALADVGARRVDDEDERDALLQRGAGRGLHDECHLPGERRRGVGGVELQPGDAPVAEQADPCGDRTGDLGREIELVERHRRDTSAAEVRRSRSRSGGAARSHRCGLSLSSPRDAPLQLSGHHDSAGRSTARILHVCRVGW